MKLTLRRGIQVRLMVPSAYQRIVTGGVCVLSVVSLLMAGLISGCSTKSANSTTSTTPGGTVIVGSNVNSLPTPPAQANVNQYSGLDMQGSIDASLLLSHAENTYYYQQPGAGSGSSAIKSGGVFSPLADLDYLAETDGQNAAYTLSGFSVETAGGISILQQAFGGFPGTDLIVGVPQSMGGCLAPKGSVGFNFLQIPVGPPLTYNSRTDSLFGYGALGYKDGVFSYSGVTQLNNRGGSASTNSVPFANGYCVFAPEGYAVESVSTSTAGTSDSVLLYIGATGVLVGKVDHVAINNGTEFPRSAFIGFVQPSSPIDLSAVTKGSYKGFYLQPGAQQPANAAYFGLTSAWITTPVFQQTSTSLVGANNSINNLIFGPAHPPRITGNIRIEFGSQDSSHPGLFPNATITEQDSGNLCGASQQSIGSDGMTYCTFPVPALIGESYGKFTILLAGAEPTSSYPLFYALVQD